MTITRKCIKFALMILLLGMAVNLVPRKVPPQGPMMLNMQKLVFYYSKQFNEYWVAATAIDDAYRCGPFDTNDVYVLLEKTNGEKVPVESNDLKIVCLGTMYNEVLARKNTLFRFNIIIDNSGSVTKSLDKVEQTLSKFIDNVPLVFEAQIIKFHHKVKKYDFSKDKKTIINQINNRMPPGNTALFDAINVGVGELVNKGFDIPLRFSIVMTDGKDNQSKVSRDEFQRSIVQTCRENHIPLFIVGVTNEVDEPLLKDITKYGLYTHIQGFPEIDKAFDLFLNVIKDTYIIKIPANVPFSQLAKIHLVKDSRPGKRETIQDFIIRR